MWGEEIKMQLLTQKQIDEIKRLKKKDNYLKDKSYEEIIRIAVNLWIDLKNEVYPLTVSEVLNQRGDNNENN